MASISTLFLSKAHQLEPKVIGSIWEQYTALAVDNYFHILSDNCQAVSKSFYLDSHPSSMAWSTDGNFLFVITEGGFMNVIYVPGNLIIDSRHVQLFSPENKPVNIFVRDEEILVLGSTGFLLRYILTCLLIIQKHESKLEDNNIVKSELKHVKIALIMLPFVKLTNAV